MADKEPTRICSLCEDNFVIGNNGTANKRVMRPAGGPDCKNPKCPNYHRETP